MSAIAAILLLAGTFFLTASTIGFLRLPDFFTRMHAISKADTLGALLSLLGLACLAHEVLDAVKLLLIAVFIFLANPVATHALARAALLLGIEPWTRRRES